MVVNSIASNPVVLTTLKLTFIIVKIAITRPLNQTLRNMIFVTEWTALYRLFNL